MSTAAIMALVGAGVFLLLLIAVTMQSIEKNNRQKRQMESTLKSRARNFSYILDGLPQGYLNRSLKALMARSLLSTYSQLQKLAPGNAEYRTAAERIKIIVEELASEPEEVTPATLTDPKQIKDVQQLLRSLYNYIATLLKSNRIDATQAKSYGIQVRRLMVQSSLDGLTQSSQEAIAEGKYRLAIHHLALAIEKMHAENVGGYFDARIQQLKARQVELEAQAETRDQAKEEAAREWDELTQEDQSWKKKAIYD